MSIDPERRCYECGQPSPRVPVCGECSANKRGFDAGVAAERERIVRLLCKAHADRYDTSIELGPTEFYRMLERIRSGSAS